MSAASAGVIGVERLDDDEGERAAGYLGADEGRGRRGAIPAKVFENIRPRAMAGLAKLVELVKK